MARIPLEDEYVDIISKAQRGLGVSDKRLAELAGISTDELDAIQSGRVEDAAIRNIAGALKLGAGALVDSAHQAWYPEPQEINGLAMFNTPYHDMRVNAFVAWDPQTNDAAVFDTGADCHDLLADVQSRGLKVKFILLTHTHRDHIADLERLRSSTRAPVFVSRREAISQAEGFDEGKSFEVGNLRIETRLTSGHAAGGITYVVQGLEKPVAVVGDAMFAGSMGGGLISYEGALRNNRQKILTLPDETVICPGHGPLSTIGEEKKHNPFFPEFQNPT